LCYVPELTDACVCVWGRAQACVKMPARVYIRRIGFWFFFEEVSLSCSKAYQTGCVCMCSATCIHTRMMMQQKQQV